MRIKDRAPIYRGRILKGWTQKQLGLLCDRSQNAVYLLESGESEAIGEDFALKLFRNLELGKPPFSLNLEDVFEDIPDSVLAEAATGASTVDEVSP